MAIRTIEQDASLDEVWDILVWEEARLKMDKDAKDLAPEVAEHVTRWKLVHDGQREAWRAEISAQAAVSAGDDDLDDTTTAIDRELLHVAGERSSPRYVRYFKKTRSDITRLGLESQLGVVREWPNSLKTEPEKGLQDLGARLAENVNAGDTAVGGRRTSAAATADHRVREIVRFIDDVNAARRTRYGVLIQRGESLGLAKDWPLRFFRRGTSSPKTKTE